MHLFKEHGVRDHQAAAGQIPAIDYGHYFAGAPGALERVAGEVAHLWADRFDGSLEDVFELQDRVATSVAGVTEPTSQATEIHRSAQRSMNDTTTYDLYVCTRIVGPRSLDPFRGLREPDRRRRAKNGFPARNKEPATNQKRLLDRKSPIQVRISLPPAGSPVRTGRAVKRAYTGWGR